MGEIAQMIGWKVETTQERCKIGQEKYIAQLIEKLEIETKRDQQRS
jgi:hypothetical protein